ncbi:MAG: MqnA/MqnD/SBP family protein [Nitrososphaerales archaeon]
MFRLGRISFLINDPVFYHFEHRNFSGIEIVSSTPKQLLQMLLEGELDMAPVASSNLIGSEKKGLVKLPIMSIHSKGPIMSAIVVSNSYPKLRRDARIAATADTSASSFILKKILHLENFQATLVDASDTSAHALLEKEDFALVIGDDALRARLDAHHIVLDIGEAWWKLTRTPAVFAVTAALEENYNKSRETFAKVDRILREIVLDNSNLQEVAKSSAKKSGLPFDLISEYFGNLRFSYDSSVDQGLRSLSEIVTT